MVVRRRFGRKGYGRFVEFLIEIRGRFRIDAVVLIDERGKRLDAVWQNIGPIFKRGRFAQRSGEPRAFELRRNDFVRIQKLIERGPRDFGRFYAEHGLIAERDERADRHEKNEAGQRGAPMRFGPVRILVRTLIGILTAVLRALAGAAVAVEAVSVGLFAVGAVLFVFRFRLFELFRNPTVYVVADRRFVVVAAVLFVEDCRGA